MKKVLAIVLVLTFVLSLGLICSYAEDSSKSNMVWNIQNKGTTSLWLGSGSKLTSSGENYVSAGFNFNTSFNGIYFKNIWANSSDKGALATVEFSLYKYDSKKVTGDEYDVKDAIYSESLTPDGNASKVLFSFDEQPAGDYLIRLKQTSTVGYIVCPGSIHEDGDANEAFFDYDIDADHMHRISDENDALAFAVVTSSEDGAFAKIGTKYGEEATSEPTTTPEVTPTPDQATSAPETATSSPDTTEKAIDTPSNSGCSSIIATSTLVLLASAVFCFRKKN